MPVNDPSVDSSPQTDTTESPILEVVIPIVEENSSDPTDMFDSTFMDFIFPEQIFDEYVASTSYDHASENVENMTNLPVSYEVLGYSIPTRIQRNHPIEHVIGSLADGVQTRSQTGHVNECLYSCFISQIVPKTWTWP